MPAGGESERGILGEQALVWRKAAKRQPLMGMVQRQLELPAAPAVCRARGLGREPQTDLPEQLAPQRVERVEAHRLIIEERDVVLDRIIVPEPRRLVGEQAERRSVRLGESELTERDHLAEDFLCRGFGDAAGDGTVTKFLPKAG